MSKPITIGETAMALDLPKGQTFDEWLEVGRNLASASKVLNWWIGDWWNAGEKFGDERRADTAKRLFGIEYQTVRDCGWVANKIPMSRRRDSIGFSHHKEVAALGVVEADQLLERAERDSWTVKDIRAEAAAIRGAIHGGPHRDTRPEVIEWSALRGAWNRASTATRARFLDEINGTDPLE